MLRYKFDQVASTVADEAATAKFFAHDKGDIYSLALHLGKKGVEIIDLKRDMLVAVGLTRRDAYALRMRDPVFAAQWDAARHAALATLKEQAHAMIPAGIKSQTRRIECQIRDGESVPVKETVITRSIKTAG